jgi:hypothetical protein
MTSSDSVPADLSPGSCSWSGGRLWSLCPPLLLMSGSRLCGRSLASRNDRPGGGDDLTDIPNIRQKGTRLGNWLTREQAKDLLTVPDRSTLKGKRTM